MTITRKPFIKNQWDAVLRSDGVNLCIGTHQMDAAPVAHYT